LVQAVAGIIGLPALQLAMCALYRGEDGERGPFLCKAFGEFNGVYLPGDKLAITAPKQKVIAKPILKVGVELLSGGKLQLLNQPEQGSAHKLIAAGRRRPVVPRPTFLRQQNLRQ